MNTLTIQNLFEANRGVLTSKELMRHGLSYYAIQRLLDKGVLDKIKRGVYTLTDSDEHEYGLITKLVPKAVFCLQSAASFYNYTTQIPLRHHLAVFTKSKYTLPKHPPIKLYYWQKSQYELGVEKELVDDIEINIYDREKTVCDFMKFRNKIGMDVVKEVLKSYLKDPKRDIVKLKRYSHELSISTVVDQYLSILI